MNKNIGDIDRALRITLGFGLVVAAITHMAGTWAWLGLIPLATGVIRICPLYSVLGLKTCKDCGGNTPDRTSDR